MHFSLNKKRNNILDKYPPEYIYKDLYITSGGINLERKEKRIIRKTGSAWCVRASAVACAWASEYVPTHRDGIGDCLALLLSAILQHLVNLFLHP